MPCRVAVSAPTWSLARAWSVAAAARLVVTLLGAIALSACQRPDPLRVGFVAGLSGRAADLGISARNGAQLAIDDANATGGVGGRQLVLLVRDDEQKPELTARLVAEFADGGVEFTIGPMISATVLSGAAVANERKLVMISPAGTTHELSGKADYFYRCLTDAAAAARAQADFLYDRGLRVLVIMGDRNNRAFVESYANAAAGRFRERGGQVVVDAGFQSGPEVRFEALAARLLTPKPDVVLLIAGAVDMALLAQNVRKLDALVAIATTPWAGTEELVQLGGRALEGALVPQYYNRDGRTPAYLQFVQRYHERFGENPGFPATIAYDAVTMGLAAQAQRKPGQSLRDALESRSEYPGLQRPTRIDRFGDGAGSVHMTTIRSGRYETVAR